MSRLGPKSKGISVSQHYTASACDTAKSEEELISTLSVTGGDVGSESDGDDAHSDDYGEDSTGGNLGYGDIYKNGGRERGREGSPTLRGARTAHPSRNSNSTGSSSSSSVKNRAADGVDVGVGVGVRTASLLPHSSVTVPTTHTNTSTLTHLETHTFNSRDEHRSSTSNIQKPRSSKNKSVPARTHAQQSEVHYTRGYQWSKKGK